MTTINLRPDEISFSRDPVVYGLHTDKPINTEGLTIEVSLFFCKGSENVFTSVYTQPCFPDSDGNVSFYPGEIINCLLTYLLPQLSSNDVVDMDSQVGRFYLEYREITSAAANPAWTSDGANIRNVIKGGTAYEQWKGGNFFSVYLASEKPFLTWQISGRLAADNERMYLYYLHTSAISAGVSAKVRVIYTDATENTVAKTVNIPAAKKFHVYQIPAGLQQLGIAAPAGKQIYCWEISVVTGNTILAAPFRYEADNRPQYDPVQLHYINSLGGMDSIRMLGTKEPSITRESAAAQTVNVGVNNNLVPPQMFTSSVDLSNTFTANTGFRGKNELMSVLDILASRGIFQEKMGRWQPLMLTSQKIALPKSSDDLFSLPLDFQEGFKNGSWTPAYKAL
jgi:hypothetical protein